MRHTLRLPLLDQPGSRVSYVAGIDFSTQAVDVVLLDEDDVLAPVWHRTILDGPDAFTRTRDLRGQHLLYPHDWDDLLAVGIEDPAGKHAIRAIARVQGAVLAHIPDGLMVKPWAPSEWRRTCGLKGNCSKDDVFAFAMEQINRWHNTPDAWPMYVPMDATDAYAIALATRQAITREQAA